MADASWTVSIDTGGTFTDAVARRADGKILEAKVASTPEDPAQGLGNAVQALVDLGAQEDQINLVCHGTTVATNATLTGNLANVALVTTEGFRDVLGYRKSNRPDVYSLTPRRPDDLVSRSMRFEIDERLDSAGNVLRELHDEDIDRLVEQLREAQPEAIAVSFLFSYLNDEHERRVGAKLQEAFPDLAVTLSCDVAREFREYPRTASTAINAALRPLVERYLVRARNALAERGVKAPFLVMQSNGGTALAERAGAEAHRLVLSGPAGGVAGLAALAQTVQADNLISLDMGGTSTDVCLLRDRQMPFTTMQEIRDHTLIAPSVDIHTIGAGGGSIAWIDETQRLRVGPQSARAVPGPACYGRGGVEPTITDAHAVLGTLGTGELAGGLNLSREKAEAAVARIAEPLGMSVEEGAEAILAIGIAHMIRALRKVSVERGLDPREFSLVPFGGAGPLHLGMLLRHMDLKNAIIPVRAGLFSADGLLVAGLRVDRAQTVLQQAGPEAYDEVQEWFRTTSQESTERLVADGLTEERIDFEVSVDCRYRGQGFELSVPLPDWSRESLEQIPERFHAAHRERYGHSDEREAVEIVTVRLAAIGSLERASEVAESLPPVELPAEAVLDRRVIHLPGEGPTETAVIARQHIPAGARFSGPAIIQQMDATTVILPGQSVEALSTLDLVVTDEQREASARDTIEESA